MAAIRSRDSRPEIALRQALHAAGLRGYRCHPKSLPGKPDVAFMRWKLAIFVDGAFWHGHPDHFTFGKLGDYWDDKIRRTQARDKAQEQALQQLGYEVIRFWDFDVAADVLGCVEQVGNALSQAGRRASVRQSTSSWLAVDERRLATPRRSIRFTPEVKNSRCSRPACGISRSP